MGAHSCDLWTDGSVLLHWGFVSWGGWTGVTNVICDIPEQTVVVSSSLPPQVVVSLIRRVFLNAHILNYIDPHRAAVYPAEPPFSLPGHPGHRYAYDDTYSYWGHTNYTPAYENAYRGRAYDNEFRPSRYSPYTYHWEQRSWVFWTEVLHRQKSWNFCQKPTGALSLVVVVVNMVWIQSKLWEAPH